MRIGLQSWGTEGDLRPFLALGQALLRRGHEVEFAFTGIQDKDFTSLAQSTGVKTQFIDDGYFVANREELARRSRESFQRSKPHQQFEDILHDLMDPVAASMLDAVRAMAARCDVVVGHFMAHTAAAAAAEHKRPYVLVALQPVFASAAYPPAGAPALPALFNSLMWKLADHVMKKGLLGRYNESRARCGLPPLQQFKPAELGDPRRVLVAVSPSLFPRPRDFSAHIEVSGFLNLSEAAQPWEPAPHVEKFLTESPPVYLSFGSMFGIDDQQTMESVQIFASALTQARARGIVQAPAEIIARAPQQDNICYIERAPHVLLFPRCSAIVHHGGAGTVQSAILAGRGSVIVPHAADQFGWADLLYARGVGAKPLKRRALAARPLADRIRAILDDSSVATRTAALAATLRAETGTERAAELIEQAAKM